MDLAAWVATLQLRVPVLLPQPVAAQTAPPHLAVLPRPARGSMLLLALLVLPASLLVLFLSAVPSSPVPNWFAPPLYSVNFEFSTLLIILFSAFSHHHPLKKISPVFLRYSCILSLCLLYHLCLIPSLVEEEKNQLFAMSSMCVRNRWS